MPVIQIGRWAVDEDDDGEIDAYYTLTIDHDPSGSDTIPSSAWELTREPIDP